MSIKPLLSASPGNFQASIFIYVWHMTGDQHVTTAPTNHTQKGVMIRLGKTLNMELDYILSYLL